MTDTFILHKNSAFVAKMVLLYSDEQGINQRTLTTTTGFQFLQTCLDRKTLLVSICRRALCAFRKSVFVEVMRRYLLNSRRQHNSPMCVLFLCCSKFISPEKVQKYFQRSDGNKMVKCVKIGVKLTNAVEKYKCARATLS